jgi:hypothetical protein
MKFSHFSHCNTLVFSIINPGGDSLASDLEKMKDGDAQAFISKIFSKKYVYNPDMLRKMSLRYFVTFDDEGSIGYSLTKKGDGHQGREVEIEVNEAHPLHLLVKKYEQHLAVGQELDPSSIINTKEVYKKAQELFDKSYRLYAEDEFYDNSLGKFRSLLKDPMCFTAAILGKYECEQAVQVQPNSGLKGQPVQPEIPFPLAPLPIADDPLATNANPSLDAEYALPQGETSAGQTALATQENTALSVRTIDSDRGKWLKSNFEQIKALKVQGQTAVEAFETIIMEELKRQGKQLMDKIDFLYYCLSDHVSFSNDLVRGLAEVTFIDAKEPFQEYEQNIAILRDKFYPYILSLCMSKLGNLLSNIHGLRLLIDEVSGGKKLRFRPKIYVTNCSLSDFYQNSDQIKDNFHSLLVNLNPKYGLQNRETPIGLTVIPKISINPSATRTDGQKKFLPTLKLSPSTKNSISHFVIDDVAEFSDLKEFIQFTTDSKLGIMHFVSLDKAQVNLNMSNFDPDAGNIELFANELEKQDEEFRKHVSICIPDATFLPEMVINGQGVVQPIPIKGAFLVAAVLIRNDQPELLQERVPNEKHAVQFQPGIGIGPDVIYSGKEMKNIFPRLFETNLMSAVNMNMEVITYLTKDKGKDCRYSFLHQAQKRPVTLLICNTVGRRENGSPIPVCEVRVDDYITVLKEFNPSIISTEWKKFCQDKTKNSDGIQALCLEDIKTRLINAIDFSF